MPFTLTCNNTEEQINAVATLMFHCGLALDMDYNIGGSGSSGGTLESSFQNFFKYKNTVNFTSRSRKTSTYNSVTNEWDFTPYTEEEWKEILRTEIDARRPIIYTGCNPEVCHAFIYDGYDASDNFHFNWGWGGSCDSYYTINTLSPGSGGTGSGSGTYNQSQNAIIGIEPVFDAAPIVDFSASQTATFTGRTINFTEQCIGFANTLSWTFEGGTPNTSNAQNPSVTYNTPGTYNVTLVAANANSSDTKTITGYITVLDNTLPSISVTATRTSFCIGESTNTTLSYNGGEGTEFVWYKDACGGTRIGAGNNITVSPATTTTYYGRWEDGSSHSTCKSVTITINALPEIPAAVTDMTLCAGSQLNFPIIAGGEWRNSSSVVVENTNIAGTYTFTITNSSTSCSNSTNIQVSESDLPTIPFTPQNLNICAGETQELQTATNGRWTYNGSTVQNANAAGTYTFTITNPATQSGTYNLVATNQNNCSAEASINVTINNSVTHEFSETACDFYEWNGTTYTNSGDFVKTLTATNGCDSIVTLHLTINASPEVEIVQKGNILMANEGFDSYNLNTGETTSTITISQIGIYTVTVVEGSCANSAEIEVSTLPTDIEQMRNSGIAVFPNPNNGQFTLNIDGIFNNSMYQIIDAKGAVIKEAKIVSKEENVSISVAPGSYFVRVITDKQVFVETIVVQ